jgi:hypothetical protein
MFSLPYVALARKREEPGGWLGFLPQIPLSKRIPNQRLKTACFLGIEHPREDLAWPDHPKACRILVWE